MLALETVHAVALSGDRTLIEDTMLTWALELATSEHAAAIDVWLVGFNLSRRHTANEWERLHCIDSAADAVVGIERVAVGGTEDPAALPTRGDDDWIPQVILCAPDLVDASVQTLRSFADAHQGAGFVLVAAADHVVAGEWRLVVSDVGLIAAAMPASADEHDANRRKMDLLFESPNTGNFTNSDLAFWGDLAFAGHYGGFRIFDVSDPADPSLVSDVACVGPQNDVSVWDRDRDGEADIVFLSVDSVRTGPECGAPAAADPRDPDAWEGIRIFDVSDPEDPFQIGAVYQDCGSHTHTLVPRPTRENRVLLYNSSYSLTPGPTCGQPAEGQPPHHDRDPLHGVIQVVEVSWSAGDPLDAEGVTAAEIAEPAINYPGDPDNAFVPAEHGLALGPLRACHDIGVHLGVGLAAGACAEQVQVWKIGRNGVPDTADPVWVFDDPVDENGATGDPGDRKVAVDFWHTARFTWDGKYVQGDDESFGDGCPPVTAIGFDATEPNSDTGRTHLLRTSDGKRMSSFMIPRPEEDAYCSMHQGNFIPTPGKYLSVNAWYNGGVDIIDFTSVRRPKEIAFFDHAPADGAGSNNWSHYWYERKPRPGRPVLTYGQDIGRGFQVFAAKVGLGRRFGSTT